MKLSERMREAIWPKKHSPTPYNIIGKVAIEWADEVAQLEAYCDKLADGLPEGMLPKDIEILQKANGDMAKRIVQLEAEIEQSREAWTRFRRWAENKRKYEESGGDPEYEVWLAQERREAEDMFNSLGE